MNASKKNDKIQYFFDIILIEINFLLVTLN